MTKPIIENIGHTKHIPAILMRLKKISNKSSPLNGLSFKNIANSKYIIIKIIYSISPNNMYVSNIILFIFVVKFLILVTQIFSWILYQAKLRENEIYYFPQHQLHAISHYQYKN